MTTLIVPRDTPSRVAGYLSRAFIPGFQRLATLFRSYERKDDFLALQAPLFLLVLLATWLGLLILGYGLPLWSSRSTSRVRCVKPDRRC